MRDYVIFRWGRDFQIRPTRGRKESNFPGESGSRQLLVLDTAPQPTRITEKQALAVLALEDREVERVRGELRRISAEAENRRVELQRQLTEVDSQAEGRVVDLANRVKELI